MIRGRARGVPDRGAIDGYSPRDVPYLYSSVTTCGQSRHSHDSGRRPSSHQPAGKLALIGEANGPKIIAKLLLHRVLHSHGWLRFGTFSKPPSTGGSGWTIPVGTCAIVGVIPPIGFDGASPPCPRSLNASP